MKTFLMFQATFLLSCMDLNTGAVLSLTVISPLGDTTINDLDIPTDFVCNAEATLLCEIKPYIDDSVTWQINGKTYAVCVLQNCVIYPPFPENHNFSLDVASGVFNLTVDPVTNCTNYNIYKCDDGITARSVEAQVKVYPTNETLKMDTTAEDRLTVTTGCVYPNEIEDLTFEWYISKYNTTVESEPFTSKKNESTVIFDCTETPSCTASHFNNTVVFDVFDDGDEYYIYVIVKHNDAPNRPSTIHSTGRRYKVKDKVKSTPSYGESKDDKPALNLMLIIVLVILITLLLVQLGIMCFLQCKIHSIRSRASGGDSEIYKRIGMTILGSIPVLGGIPIYITWKVFYRDVYQVTHGMHHGTNTDLSNNSYSGVSLNRNGTMSHEVHEYDIIVEHHETETTLNSSHTETNTGIQIQSSTVTASPSSEHVGTYIESRGISASFPDENDDMATDSSGSLYRPNLPPIRQHPEEHHHDSHHHHFSKAVEKRRESLKPIMDGARKAGKHVELVRGQLFINNCLYHPEDNHTPTHSRTHHDMFY